MNRNKAYQVMYRVLRCAKIGVKLNILSTENAQEVRASGTCLIKPPANQTKPEPRKKNPAQIMLSKAYFDWVPQMKLQ